MSDNVVTLRGLTTLPIPVERVLSAAVEANEERPFRRLTIVAVFDDDGEEYFAGSDSDAGAILWDMARAKHFLLKNADDE